MKFSIAVYYLWCPPLFETQIDFSSPYELRNGYKIHNKLARAVIEYIYILGVGRYRRYRAALSRDSYRAIRKISALIYSQSWVRISTKEGKLGWPDVLFFPDESSFWHLSRTISRIATPPPPPPRQQSGPSPPSTIATTPPPPPPSTNGIVITII